jgi:regulatory protein
MKKKGLSMQGSDPMEYNEALRQAAALCSRQEQCSNHIMEKLNHWNISEDDSLRIIDLLQKEKYLDDQRYATFYTRDKFRLNGWGKVKISVMLRRKGIPESVIKEALNEIDDETYFNACAKLISEKSATLKEKNHFARKGKLFRHAAQRGFESELIHRILNTELPA